MKNKLPPNQAEAIQKYILKNISKHSNDIVIVTMKAFNVTRTTVLRHIKHLIKKNQLIKTGTTKNVTYLLPTDKLHKYIFSIDKQLDEFHIWKKYFSNYFSKLDLELNDIIYYAVTEMINNAKDHSQGKKLTITWQKSHSKIYISIKDDGIGIFNKLSSYLNVKDKREVILHLNKGKLTTDPANHTGEGIFFTSKVIENFSISSNGLKYIKDNIEKDWFLESVKTQQGTTVELISHTRINPNINLTETFKKFQDDDTLAFNKTEFSVTLAKLDEEVYMSRSQAKRVLRGLEPFKTITLDFSKVRLVGQGFVDEIFRVYQNKYPEKQIKYINANDDVKFMIERAIL